MAFIPKALKLYVSEPHLPHTETVLFQTSEHFQHVKNKPKKNQQHLFFCWRSSCFFLHIMNENHAKTRQKMYILGHLWMLILCIYFIGKTDCKETPDYIVYNMDYCKIK